MSPASGHWESKACRAAQRSLSAWPLPDRGLPLTCLRLHLSHVHCKGSVAALQPHRIVVGIKDIDPTICNPVALFWVGTPKYYSVLPRVRHLLSLISFSVCSHEKKFQTSILTAVWAHLLWASEITTFRSLPPQHKVYTHESFSMERPSTSWHLLSKKEWHRILFSIIITIIIIQPQA